MTKPIADRIYTNGYIYTADANDTVVEAIAVADGVIIARGSNQEVRQYVGERTISVDLQGQMMMPGIVDGHMHPFWGGDQLKGCSLNYQSLTVDQIIEQVQDYLDRDPIKGENDWLRVTAWLRQGMLPEGADMTRDDMDRLNTQRPVFLFSNDCHTLVANSRALALFGIDENTPEPSDGKIGKDHNGRLTGILEDAPAMRASDSLPPPSQEQAEHVAQLVQQALNAQGVTTVMDARVSALQLDAFKGLQEKGLLHIRVQGSREITPDDSPTPQAAKAAVAKAVEFAKKYDQPIWSAEPGIGLHSIKLFVDGVLQPPTRTAYLLHPYLENRGSAEKPDWQPTERLGDLYFSPAVLDALIEEIAAAGFDPHLHTVGEGAISLSLDAVEKMRQRYPDKDIRPGFAHNELVDAKDYQRFARLGAIAFLSFQWAAPTPEIVEAERHMLGESRFQNLEPIAKFIDAGARVVFGSDWPIDGLDEWYALKVAATRRGRDIDGNLHPRLDNDRDLTVTEVLRSATIDSAYGQRREDVIGSLEVGKFADMIVLDRNVFDIPAEQIDRVKVMLTIVGGKVVYQADGGKAER
jgi:predicted amidohydrolase YtcJ